MSAPAAAFVDRDGVINELVADSVNGRAESPLRVSDVALIVGAAGALRRLRSSGLLLVGVSNQPAAAKARVSMQELMAVQARVVELVAADGAHFDAFRICLHHPQGTLPELSGECDCRKPAPGMLLAAAADLGIDLPSSWMIGDTDADVRAGQAAGCRTVLVQNRLSAHKRDADLHPDAVVDTLAAAVELLLCKGVH